MAIAPPTTSEPTVVEKCVQRTFVAEVPANQAKYLSTFCPDVCQLSEDVTLILVMRCTRTPRAKSTSSQTHC